MIKNKLNEILREAKDESTSPKRLKEILRDYYKENEIKKTLTSNPNTPLDILIKLGEHYPTELLENPALDLYLLSNPNLLNEMPHSTLISILKSPKVPQEFILATRKKIDNKTTIDRSKADILATLIIDNPKEGRDLSSADLVGANLKGACLINANLSGADLGYSDLSGANLKSADLTHVDMRGVKIDKNTVIDKKWYIVWELVNKDKPNRNLKEVDLSGAWLNYVSLYDADLTRANLSGADLGWACLHYSNLTDANLSNTDLNNAYLNKTNLTRANFTGADLEHTDFTGANLTDINLTGARLKWTVFD